MLKVPLVRSILIFLLEGYLVLQVLAVTCYHLDGSNAGPTNALCNPNATGGEGSHSACCNAQNGDACLSTGLCLNTIARQQSHVLWSTACTDSTFQDPSCPQYCHGLNIDNAHLRTCNDTFWCCESGANILTTQECCDTAFRLTQPIGHVIAQLQSGGGATLPMATASSAASSVASGSTNTDSSNEDPSKIPPGAVAGLAVEGFVIALAFAALAYMIWRNSVLRRRLKKIQATASGQQQYYGQQPYLPHAGTAPHHMDAYGVLRSPSPVNELPAPDPVCLELPSEPRGPKSPATY
ncbi:hypothetical protein F4811DRAFT_262060 [Daldinia bambusicola]|nr:hypothetical protein F4811DRAFT_262060 [Daldinia bambusicola]